MNIRSDIGDNGKGSFFIEDSGRRLGEMVVSVASGNLTVFHTEVDDSLKGKGASTELLNAMTAYAREHNLKVIPLCSYVITQFKRHQDEYKDVWNNDGHNK
ncbi:MAG: GNAT family N-acetyltransferase [Chryseolinea sp.]